MSERKLVGTIAVDSGQIAIVDPSHILEIVTALTAVGAWFGLINNK